MTVRLILICALLSLAALSILAEGGRSTLLAARQPATAAS
jgi:hypothetical protein